jgi:hypothetical protein
VGQADPAPAGIWQLPWRALVGFDCWFIKIALSTNFFTVKLIHVKSSVLTFAPAEKLERGPHGPFLVCFQTRQAVRQRFAAWREAWQ